MPQYQKRRKLVIAKEGKSVNIIMFASTGDCLELFASEGDFVTSTERFPQWRAIELSSELDLAGKSGTTCLYLKYFDFQVHSRTFRLLRLQFGQLTQ